MNFYFFAVLSIIAGLSQPTMASPGHSEPIAMPKDFAVLKQLVGNWQGTGMMDGKEQTITVEYQLTSGGTAITEKLGAGTPNEMISVYHKDGKTLGMTHFCARGNAPQMALKKSDATSLTFEMTKPLGISSPKESHMHAVTLTTPDADTLKHEWVNYNNGKKAETAIFNFKRKS